jgi:hypothetical protein
LDSNLDEDTFLEQQFNDLPEQKEELLNSQESLPRG